MTKSEEITERIKQKLDEYLFGGDEGQETSLNPDNVYVVKKKKSKTNKTEKEDVNTNR